MVKNKSLIIIRVPIQNLAGKKKDKINFKKKLYKKFLEEIE